jgi:hypothetical protein
MGMDIRTLQEGWVSNRPCQFAGDSPVDHRKIVEDCHRVQDRPLGLHFWEESAVTERYGRLSGRR